MAIGCRIEGIPKTCTRDELISFLTGLVPDSPSVSVVEWHERRQPHDDTPSTAGAQSGGAAVLLVAATAGFVRKKWTPLLATTALQENTYLTATVCALPILSGMAAADAVAADGAEGAEAANSSQIGRVRSDKKTKQKKTKSKEKKTKEDKENKNNNKDNNNKRQQNQKNQQQQIEMTETNNKDGSTKVPLRRSRAKRIAKAFYDHLKEDASRLEQAADREQTGMLFQDFYKTTYVNKDNQNEEQETETAEAKLTTRRQLVRLEAMVMSSLREQRLVKSKRVDGSRTVVMVFAGDAPGDFPKQIQVRSTRERVKRFHQQEQENKRGVTVSEAPEGVHAALHPDYDSFQLVIMYESDEKPAPLLQLESVQVSGSHQKNFTVEHFPLPAPILSPSSEDESQLPFVVKVCFNNPSKRLGVFRASVRCHFHVSSSSSHDERFVIVRSFSIKSSGNPELQDMLKPQSPYVRRPPKWWQRKVETEVEEAPPPPGLPVRTGGDKEAKNPFRFLPFHSIPEDIVSMLTNFELEHVLPDMKPDEDGNVEKDSENETGDAEGEQALVVPGYGNFWKHLLWASEFQNYQDIQLFDMEETRLTRQGKHVVLQVPGLAEGRPSVLRGDLVHVTWNNKLYKGRVVRTHLLEVLLDFHASFLKQFDPAVDTVDVRFTFSRMTYRTSHEAVARAETSMKHMLYPNQQTLDSILSSPDGRGRSVPDPWKFANRDLNDEQRMAVQNIVAGKARPLPYVIFGPPGTGKTTTVVEAVYQLAKHSDRLTILLVAPSNDAADILVERLSQYFPPSEMTRILAYSRTLESVPKQIMDYVREGLDSEQQMAQIMSARIVVATVNLAARFSYIGVPAGHFDVLCVDEAGHAIEPEVIAVAASSILDFSRTDQRVGQLVLAGDPKQLGPIVTSPVGLAFGLAMSYMERLMGRDVYARVNGSYPPDLLTKLVRNYRSHPAIVKLPNQMFYDDELKCCGDKMATHNMANWEHLPCKGFPVLFHAMEGENLREARSPSWFNPQEAEQVVLYAQMLLKDTRPPLRPEDIGIITPYNRQVQKIQLALKSQGIKDIKVGSVECFQGQERRCIIVSTVRSEPEQVSSDLRYHLGFVANEKRFNVAVTRAKTLLIVIGSPKVLSLDQENWKPFLKYCHENNSWAGDEWDPTETVEELEAGDSLVEREWDIIEGPSEAVAQEAVAFIGREE